MNDQNITLDITIDEANKILQALGTQPFQEVFQLVEKIQQQAASQLNEPKKD